jgi:multiple sugar transport system substrate-binding protein
MAMPWRVTVLLASVLVLKPLGVQAADLVVWWQKGFYAQEDEAVRETMAAFEQGSGKRVELVFLDQEEHPAAIAAALGAGHPPDFAFGTLMTAHISAWAFDDRLVDLSDAIGHFSDLFDPDALDRAMLVNAKTGQKALYALPMGRSSNHVHVWKNLLEQVGFTLADIPREWNAFWSFWCDDVQPALRREMGRDDIWGVGLAMSEVFDTQFEFFQFVTANDADYVTRDGQLVIDDPEIRQKLVGVVDSYTAFFRKGCTPPGSVAWGNIDNNKAFLGQTVVMTANETLSIPNALKPGRPDDYYQRSATIEWPLDPEGTSFPITGFVHFAVVPRSSANVATAKDFVRFLVAEGWLAHYLNFSRERLLPPMQKLLDQPFWLDPSDPHYMAAVMQLASRPHAYNYTVASGNWRHDVVWQEYVWAKAIHRVVTENIAPNRRSTRRSRASSRFWRSDRPNGHTRSAAYYLSPACSRVLVSKLAA